MSDTIYALSTPPGRGGVAIVRISGPAADHVFELFDAPVPEPRMARYTVLKQKDGEALDAALLLRFPGPASFTGEDVVELHVHGGRAIIDGVFAVLAEATGFRLADPGEFTRRAFQNGKMDLTEAEGLIDLIDAETEAQRKQAFRQMRGGLRRKFEDWATRITKTLAWFEAAIDFPDEDLPPEVLTSVSYGIYTLQQEISGHLDDRNLGERLREGPRMAIVGPPNAGKSSLVNWLSQRDAAIVSEIAGTTRDVVEVHLGISGYPLVVADTAGLRESMDEIESEGIRRAKRWADEADLRLFLVDGSDFRDVSRETTGVFQDGDILVLNKIDKTGTVSGPDGSFRISVKEEIGLVELLEEIERRVKALFESLSDGAITRTRHREGLADCLASLERATEGLDNDMPIELPAEDLRMAVRSLGRITGTVDVEDLLDIVFRDFCIGK